MLAFRLFAAGHFLLRGALPDRRDTWRNRRASHVRCDLVIRRLPFSGHCLIFGTISVTGSIISFGTLWATGALLGFDALVFYGSLLRLGASFLRFLSSGSLFALRHADHRRVYSFSRRAERCRITSIAGHAFHLSVLIIDLGTLGIRGALSRRRHAVHGRRHACHARDADSFRHAVSRAGLFCRRHATYCGSLCSIGALSRNESMIFIYGAHAIFHGTLHELGSLSPFEAVQFSGTLCLHWSIY